MFLYTRVCVDIYIHTVITTHVQVWFQVICHGRKMENVLILLTRNILSCSDFRKVFLMRPQDFDRKYDSRFYA